MPQQNCSRLVRSIRPETGFRGHDPDVTCPVPSSKTSVRADPQKIGLEFLTIAARGRYPHNRETGSAPLAMGARAASRGDGPGPLPVNRRAALPHTDRNVSLDLGHLLGAESRDSVTHHDFSVLGSRRISAGKRRRESARCFAMAQPAPFSS